MARTRIADLQQRIDELARMRDALTRLIVTCDQHAPSANAHPA